VKPKELLIHLASLLEDAPVPKAQFTKIAASLGVKGVKSTTPGRVAIKKLKAAVEALLEEDE